MSKRPGDPGYPGQWCVHFRSMGHHQTCEAGVSYATFAGKKYDERPCFLDKKTGESKPGAAHCEHLRRPTADEIAAHEKWAAERMTKLGLAMTAILPFRKTHRGKRHVIDCPACGSGQLHFSIAASNGHCHAQCTTAGCIAWME